MPRGGVGWGGGRVHRHIGEQVALAQGVTDSEVSARLTEFNAGQ